MVNKTTGSGPDRKHNRRRYGPSASAESPSHLKKLSSKIGFKALRLADQPRAADSPATFETKRRNSSRGIKMNKAANLLFSPDGATNRRDYKGRLAASGGGLGFVTLDGKISNRFQVRKLIGSTNLKDLPTPFIVRFGPEDIRTIDAERFKIVVDTVDAAVAGVMIQNREWEPHTSSIMSQHLRPGMSVIDIGANNGWFSLLASSLVEEHGSVIAVEPWSENCRLLLLSIAENGFTNIELWPFALDQSQGWSPFMPFIGSNAGFSLESPEALRSGVSSIVPTFALDHVLPPDAPVDFVKIDVEGAEGRVLRGAKNTFSRCRPAVISEFSLNMSQELDADPIAYLDWFTNNGWDLNVISKDTGDLRPFRDSRSLLEWWPQTPLHIEDLFFQPR